MTFNLHEDNKGFHYPLTGERGLFACQNYTDFTYELSIKHDNLQVYD